MTGSLEGVRVVDCTQWAQGGVAGAMLGDMGADVIKVEERVAGDGIRGFVARPDQAGQPPLFSFMFEHTNRNKRGITLDLRKEKGKQIMYRLVEKSDIFLHNWRIGVAEKLGMDYDTLARLNPQLIYVQASGWGPQGPVSRQPAYERVAQARSGMMYCVGEPDMPPLSLAPAIIDIIAATIAVVGTLAALQARERIGQGQRVDTSLLGGLMHVEGVLLASFLLDGREFPRGARARMWNPMYNQYRCADSRWISLAALQADRYWPDFCKVMGIQHLQKDQRFESMEARARNCEELIRILDQIFATKSRDEWLKLFGAVAFVCAPVQTIPEAVEDSQVLASEYIIDFNHPTLGPIKAVGFPYKFSKTPATLRRPAPELGQHTEEVLMEIGYAWDDIATLRDDEII